MHYYSSCNPLDENVKYINALDTSTLEKYTVVSHILLWQEPESSEVYQYVKYEKNMIFAEK